MIAKNNHTLFIIYFRIFSTPPKLPTGHICSAHLKTTAHFNIYFLRVPTVKNFPKTTSLDRTLVRFVCTNLTRAFFFLPFVSGNRYLASQDYLKSPISLVESRLKQNKYDLHLYYSSSSSPSFCYPRSHFRDKRIASLSFTTGMERI